MASVAAALAGVFAILVNKICKIMAIFEKLDSHFIADQIFQERCI